MNRFLVIAISLFIIFVGACCIYAASMHVENNALNSSTIESGITFDDFGAIASSASLSGPVTELDMISPIDDLNHSKLILPGLRDDIMQTVISSPTF